MNENEFDKIIQDAAGEELELPGGFGWDEMNILTPVQSRRRKRRMGFYLLFGLAFVLSAIGGIFWLSDYEITEYEGQVRHADQASSSPSEQINTSSPERPQASQTNNAIAPQSDTAVIPSGASIQQSNPIISSEEETPSVNQSETSTIRVVRLRQNLEGGASGNNIGSINLSENRLGETSGSYTANGEKQNAVSVVSSLAVSREYPKSINSISEAYINFEYLPGLMVSGSMQVKPEAPKRSFEFGVGLNSFRTKQDVPFSNSFALRSLGYSIYASLPKQLNRNYQLNLGVRFNALHYYYSGSVLFSTTVDPDTYRLIRSYRVINHNNYLLMAEVPVGMSRTFLKTQKFDLQATLQAAPGILLASRGTYISDERRSIENLQLSKGNPQFLLSLGVACSVGYRIDENNTIRLQPMFSRHLLNFRYSDSSSTHLKPDILFINVGLTRTIR
jgi:hypothetical protein